MTTTSPDNPQRNRAAGLFLVISISFGLLFSALTLPYQAPDEAAHFFRAWSIAEGKLFIEHRNGQSGAMLPASRNRLLGARFTVLRVIILRL